MRDREPSGKESSIEAEMDALAIQSVDPTPTLDILRQLRGHPSDPESITDAMNAALQEIDQTPDPWLTEATRRTLEQTEWDPPTDDRTP